MPRTHPGYTLLELMIVVAVLGVLTSVFAPRVAGYMRAANERATLAKLGSLRSAITLYHTDVETYYPGDLTPFQQAGNRYITQILPVFTSAHGKTNATAAVPAYDPAADTGGWGYVGEGSDAGRVYIQCTHTDYSGKVWNEY